MANRRAAKLKVCEKYLVNYAEPEIILLASLNIPKHQVTLTVPAYDEGYGFIDRLTPLLNHIKCLVIIVVNQPDNRPYQSDTNSKLVSKIEQNLLLIQTFQNASLFNFQGTTSHLLLVDRFSAGLAIPSKEGVGLARKIAADLATSLIIKGTIEQPWIYCTDCDAHLPDNYFDQGDNHNQAAAVLYPFRHSCADDEIGRATQLYEYALHYYQRGLAWAGSPYAFPTLGSTIAIHVDNYCQVRGFPKRNGGEDFYLLNKLAKTGGIQQLQAPIITIDSRKSHRVPFGTGPAVEKISQLENPDSMFTVYNPQCFIYLKTLLGTVNEIAALPDKKLNGFDNILTGVIQQMNMGDAITHAEKQSETPEIFLRHFTTWFDAFRTLKFIHLLRDAGLENMGYAQSQNAPWQKAS